RNKRLGVSTRCQVTMKCHDVCKFSATGSEKARHPWWPIRADGGGGQNQCTRVDRLDRLVSPLLQLHYCGDIAAIEHRVRTLWFIPGLPESDSPAGMCENSS